MSGAKQERLERLRESYRQITNDEDEVARQARLQQRRERDAARRASETGEARQLLQCPFIVA